MVRQTCAIGIRLVLLLTLLGGIALVAPTSAPTPAAAKHERNERNGKKEQNRQEKQDGQKKQNGQDEQNEEDVQDQPPTDERDKQDETAADEEDEQKEPEADGGGRVDAAAPQTVYTIGGGGSARLQNYGDHVFLCDHAEDNHGVGVYVNYNPEGDAVKYITEAYWYGGGSKGSYACRDINLKIKEWTTVTLEVCLADHTKKGGKKPKPIVSTCDNNAFLNNG